MEYEITARLVEKFTEKYIINDDNECWEWTACIKPAGIGKMAVAPSPNKRDWLTDAATRVSYRIYVLDGLPVPEGMIVAHTGCTNKRCVNPAHLSLLTQEESAIKANDIKKNLLHI